MLRLKKIAVTGGVSSGKSTVCRFFKDLGAWTVSADKIVHQLLSSNTNLGQKVINLLGSDIVQNGHIDRSKIAKKVFNNSELLKSLENLLHPAVEEVVEEEYQHISKNPSFSLFVVEIPLLFETGSERFYDYTLVVVANESKCRKRFSLSTGYVEAEYDKRMTKQMLPQKKADLADFVIDNNGNEADLKKSVHELWIKLKSID